MPEQQSFVPDSAREQTPNIFVEVLQGDNRQGISEYIDHEANNGFETHTQRAARYRERGIIEPQLSDDDAEKKARELFIGQRQKEIQENRLQVVMGRDGAAPDAPLVATSVVVLENGTMGKKIGPDEAWAAGTLVKLDQRSLAIGEHMAAAQEEIAKANGKKELLTGIDVDNLASIGLRLKVGYELWQVREDDKSYGLRKDLSTGKTESGWASKVLEGTLRFPPADADQFIDEAILIDSNDTARARAAIEQGYRGVALLWKKNFEGVPPPFEGSAIVFTRENKP
ncbi:MAG: hypothetical protein WC817_02455 [Patescibacteria group bacterium]|jgi:hypothetical protein